MLRVPVSVNYRIGVQQSVVPPLLSELRNAREQSIALDPAVHHYMIDMDEFERRHGHGFTGVYCRDGREVPELTERSLICNVGPAR